MTLSGPAPVGGMTVTLTSDNPAGTVPASVFVPEGQTSATFPIATLPVTSGTLVTIVGTLNGVPQEAPLTVNPVAVALPLPVVVVKLSCTAGLGAALAVVGTATQTELLAAGCTLTAGVNFSGGGDTCTTDTLGTCTLDVPATATVIVTETNPPAGSQPVVNPITVTLTAVVGGSAMFVNVPIAVVPSPSPSPTPARRLLRRLSRQRHHRPARVLPPRHRHPPVHLRHRRHSRARRHPRRHRQSPSASPSAAPSASPNAIPSSSPAPSVGPTTSTTPLGIGSASANNPDPRPGSDPRLPRYRCRWIAGR